VFSSDGAVPIDNRVSEREMSQPEELALRGQRARRKAAAILASLTRTCRRHDIDPPLYLTQLPVNLPATPISQLAKWPLINGRCAVGTHLRCAQEEIVP
jgi:hypothetical protein